MEGGVRQKVVDHSSFHPLPSTPRGEAREPGAGRDME